MTAAHPFTPPATLRRDGHTKRLGAKRGESLLHQGPSQSEDRETIQQDQGVRSLNRQRRAREQSPPSLAVSAEAFPCLPFRQAGRWRHRRRSRGIPRVQVLRAPQRSFSSSSNGPLTLMMCTPPYAREALAARPPQPAQPQAERGRTRRNAQPRGPWHAFLDIPRRRGAFHTRLRARPATWQPGTRGGWRAGMLGGCGRGTGGAGVWVRSQRVLQSRSGASSANGKGRAGCGRSADFVRREQGAIAQRAEANTSRRWEAGS